MTSPSARSSLLLAAGTVLALWAGKAAAGDPLPSWSEGPPKKAIVDFVARVTTNGGPDFVPVAERIAAFDNDGTLWSEQPTYVQVAFALDRIQVLSAEHPEWKAKQPFKAALEHDWKTIMAASPRDRLELIAATHAGMTTEEFERTVTDWLAKARHPRFKRPYTDLVFLPMLELLAYLRASGFKTYVVSGGGVEFMRPWTERVYGIPPEQVVGMQSRSSTKSVMAGRCCCGSPRSNSSTTRRANPRAFTAPSAGGRSWRSATPMATTRCSAIRPPVRGPDSA